MSAIKVAIIDDESEYVADLTKGLGILGYQVVTATSGSAAIELISSERPDVVLCDYKLGDMDGTEVIKIAKPDNPETRFVLVTAYYDESFQELFRKAGVDNVIYKPIDLVEIDSTIRKMVESRRN